MPQKFEFNYSHDYDVIIFALERGSSNFNHFQQAFFDQARGMVRISNIQSKHQDAPFIFWIIFTVKVTGQCSAHARKLLRMPHTSQCTWLTTNLIKTLETQVCTLVISMPHGQVQQLCLCIYANPAQNSNLRRWTLASCHNANSLFNWFCIGELCNSAWLTSHEIADLLCLSECTAKTVLLKVWVGITIYYYCVNSASGCFNFYSLVRIVETYT